MSRVSPALLTLLLAACGTPVARTVAVIPLVPPGTESTMDEALSAVAAFRIWREIGEHGYGAILGEPAGRPSSCVLARGSEVEADLRVFVWVQVVDLPLDEFPDEPARTWGGMVLLGDDGRQYASSVNLRESPEAPGDAFHRVAEPGEPAAVAAADAFGGWILKTPGELAARVSELLGGGA